MRFKTEFGASFPHCHIPLEGKRRKAHTKGLQSPAWVLRPSVSEGRKGDDGHMCWVWKAVALAEVSELRQGSLHILYEKWLCFFQLVILFFCETWGLCVGLDVTNFSQANGIAGGTFDHQMELIWNEESTKEHWTVTEGACCAQDRQFSPLL